MLSINRCKTCKKQPTVQYYGRDNKVDIFCPSSDSECYPGRCVTGTDYATAVEEWNRLHGEKD